jgi:hypothetical protein
MKLQLKLNNAATKCRDTSGCGVGNNSKIHSPSTEMSLEYSAAKLQSLQLLFGLNITREPAWTVRGSHPGGEDFLARFQTGSGAQLASCRMGTGYCWRLKGWGVALIAHCHLAPWLNKG